jgi:hypothetical protein
MSKTTRMIHSIEHVQDRFARKSKVRPTETLAVFQADLC